jgi:hypothetical protein
MKKKRIFANEYDLKQANYGQKILGDGGADGYGLGGGSAGHYA